MLIATHRDWLRCLAVRGVLLTLIVVLWSMALGVGIYRMLGVNITSVTGRPSTFVDVMLLHGLAGAFPATILECLLLLSLFGLRVAFRWWLIAGLLLVVGTPIALYSGWNIASYLWTLNQGGVPWEGIAPQVIGVASAWVLSVPFTMWFSRYRIIVVRRREQCRSPCPRCQYDLYGSSERCPECGWVFPIGLSSHCGPQPPVQFQSNVHSGE